MSLSEIFKNGESLKEKEKIEEIPWNGGSSKNVFLHGRLYNWEFIISSMHKKRNGLALFLFADT